MRVVSRFTETSIAETSIAGLARPGDVSRVRIRVSVEGANAGVSTVCRWKYGVSLEYSVSLELGGRRVGTKQVGRNLSVD
ncbi:hypothetical protein Pla52o_24230 [Novipirellula galeiformis]|uniref:Uncharacterized protein n=1 Tax=Novipirellula galeiformis TaxID=2528004 RepID=A0A5C6CHW3_9BACT|nr:hypothetical protein Pla52o_24230 [Novipirellula galeiformis]